MVVTDKEGQAEFWEPENTRLASLSRRAASREGVGQAKRLIRPATTIDGFCRARGVQPDVLKIDVEGAEWNVLHGARRFLENRRGSILLEVHPQPLADFGATSERLLAELESFGWGAEELYARGRRDDPAATVHYLVEPADG
jgi:hypothetical protein